MTYYEVGEAMTLLGYPCVRFKFKDVDVPLSGQRLQYLGSETGCDKEKTAPCGGLFFLYGLVAVYEVVERSDVVLLEVGTEVHITANPEVQTVLLLDSPDVGIIALIAKLAVLVAGAVPPHSWRVSHK